MTQIIEIGYTEKVWTQQMTCSNCSAVFVAAEDDLHVRYGCDDYYGHCDTYSWVRCPACRHIKNVSPPKVIEQRLWKVYQETRPPTPLLHEPLFRLLVVFALALFAFVFVGLLI